MAKLISFVRKHYIAVGVLTLSTAAALWFAGNLLANVIYFNDPRHQDEALKYWMSPHYMSMSYDIPRPLVSDLLGVPPDEMRGKTLGEIAALRGMTLDQLTDHVRDGVTTYRAKTQ